MNYQEAPVIAIPNVVFYPTTTIDIYLNNNSHIKMLEDFYTNKEIVVISLGIPVSPNDLINQHKVVYAPARIASCGFISNIQTTNDRAIKASITGQKRIIIGDHIQSIPYSKFIIQDYPDFQEEMHFTQNQILRLEGILEQWLRAFVIDSVEYNSIKNQVTRLDSLIDHICHFILEDLELKQLLLENTSLAERVRILNTLLKEENPFQADPEISQKIKEFDTKIQPN